MKLLESTGRYGVAGMLSMRCALLVGGAYGQTVNLTQCIPTLSILQRAASDNGLDRRHRVPWGCSHESSTLYQLNEGRRHLLFIPRLLSGSQRAQPSKMAEITEIRAAYGEYSADLSHPDTI